MELRTTMKTLRSLEQVARSIVPVAASREPMRLTRDDVAVFERARRSGYLLGKGETARIYLLWYAWCSANKQPFVSILCRRRLAFIEFELRDRATELDDEGLALFEQTLRACSPVTAAYCRGLDRRACTDTGVPNDKVEALARELLRIAGNHLRPARASSIIDLGEPVEGKRRLGAGHP